MNFDLLNSKDLCNIGCYGDSSTRDLPNLLIDGSLTIELCISTCANNSYSYAAMQAG